MRGSVTPGGRECWVIRKLVGLSQPDLEQRESEGDRKEQVVGAAVSR